MNFIDPGYLQFGNSKQKKVFELINEINVLRILKAYNPIIVGTIPIEIDLPESDIDIICYACDLQKFKLFLTENFNRFPYFKLKEKKIRNQDSVIGVFKYNDFTFEIFGQDTPTEQQYAYRHMIIEHELLQSHPESFRQEVISLKKSGLKTEEAFAKILNLKGDPFEGLLLYKSKT